MRLFIPVVTPGPDAAVSPHFGTAQFFAVVARSGAVSFAEVPERVGAECGGWRRIGIRAGDAVACRHLGRHAFELLHAAQVEVFTTDARTVGDAAAQWAGRELQRFNAEAEHVCSCHH